MAIPRILHQIWLGNQTIRPDVLMQTWRDKHPDWEYCLWTDKNIPKLINQHQFDLVDGPTIRSDILRYEILMRYGGVYVDADSVCLESIDDLIHDNELFLCYFNELAAPGRISNAFIGVSPQHDLMSCLLGLLSLTCISQGKPNVDTGPVFVTNTIQRYGFCNRCTIYPSHYFIPDFVNNTYSYKGKGKVYARHLWGHVKGYYQFTGIKLL